MHGRASQQRDDPRAKPGWAGIDGTVLFPEFVADYIAAATKAAWPATMRLIHRGIKQRK